MAIFNSHVKLPEGILDGYKLILYSSLLVWDYLRSPAKN